ncbi:MAG: hypothetical protein LAT55_08405, partial [Opitutales bacterium]|nr:hypothetical protein [Opitutales bacterium]
VGCMWKRLVGCRAKAQRDLRPPGRAVAFPWEGEGLSELEWSGCGADSWRDDPQTVVNARVIAESAYAQKKNID